MGCIRFLSWWVFWCIKVMKFGLIFGLVCMILSVIFELVSLVLDVIKLCVLKIMDCFLCLIFFISRYWFLSINLVVGESFGLLVVVLIISL